MQRSADGQASPRPSIGIVVPAYNAETTLSECLEAIMSMTLNADKIVVINDGSTDRTATIACAFDVDILTIPSPSRGPAYARNIGVAALQSDLAMFVDSDVIVHPDALARLLADLREHHATAAFGSYDDRPRSQRATSLYANLRHHYVHQHGSRNATSFWSGLGLIDCRVFMDLGGFDDQRYRLPSIEDVEFGARLTRSGHRIRLVPEAQGTHWKDWRLTNVWWTDIARRAYPWTILITEGKGPSGDLNLALAERIKAVFAIITLTGISAGFRWPVAFAVAALAASVVLALNYPFFAFMFRRVRLPAFFVAVAMHWFYHVYAVLTFVATLIWTSTKRRFDKGREVTVRPVSPLQ